MCCPASLLYSIRYFLRRAAPEHVAANEKNHRNHQKKEMSRKKRRMKYSAIEENDETQVVGGERSNNRGGQPAARKGKDSSHLEQHIAEVAKERSEVLFFHFLVTNAICALKLNTELGLILSSSK